MKSLIAMCFGLIMIPITAGANGDCDGRGHATWTNAGKKDTSVNVFASAHSSQDHRPYIYRVCASRKNKELVVVTISGNKQVGRLSPDQCVDVHAADSLSVYASEEVSGTYCLISD